MVPPPRGNPKSPLQMLVANLDASDYLGPNCDRADLQRRGSPERPGGGAQGRRQRPGTRVTKLFMFDGLKRVEIEEAAAGDIVCLAGIENITIGETITSPDHRVPIPRIAVDEPTVSMIFGVNTSPMAGREGQYVTSRNLRDRLARELLGNVSLRVEDTDTPEQVKVIGRGELQLSILIEMMRRKATSSRSPAPTS